MTSYHVEVSDGFKAHTRALARTRAGITVDRTYGYEGPLTDEQVAAIEADDYLIIKKTAAAAPAAPADDEPAPAPKGASKKK